MNLMNNKFKIMFVAPRYHTNQINIVETLIKQDHKVKYFVVQHGISEDYNILSPQKIDYSILFQLLMFLFNKKNDNDFIRKYCIPKLYKYFKNIRDFSPSIIIIRNPHYFYSLISIIYAKLLSINIILYTQDPYYKKAENKRYIMIRFFNSVFKSAWFTPVKGDESDKILPHSYLLPSIINVREKRLILGYRSDIIKILMIGKFEKRKNHLLLIKAIEELISEGYNINLTIIGEVSTEKHKEQLKVVRDYLNNNRINSIIKIMHNINYKSVQNEYSNFDLFVLPSKNEPFSISILEAMGNSLPVICSDSCGTKGYIEDGINGYVFKSDNLVDLVIKIKLITSDKKKLAKMGEESYKISKDKYNSSVFYSEFRSIIKNRFGI